MQSNEVSKPFLHYILELKSSLSVAIAIQLNIDHNKTKLTSQLSCWEGTGGVGAAVIISGKLPYRLSDVFYVFIFVTWFGTQTHLK